MAECMNCGLENVTDIICLQYLEYLSSCNEDLRQGIIPPGPMFADMILREMQDLKCVDLKTLPSQNEENSSTILSCNQTDNEELVSPAVNNISNAVESSAKEFTDDDIEECKSLSPIKKQTRHIADKHTQVPSIESSIYFLPQNYNKRNPWRRISGFHTAGHEPRSATYPARSSVEKIRFAQAKKPLNYLYSYFSVEILDCDEESSITIGVTRKDYPSKMAPGKMAGSIGFFSDTGSILLRDSVQLDGFKFSKGDTIGCGIIYPPHYKRYADLSTDDNSDGMTDVVLTSLLNKRAIDFVCNVLNLNVQKEESSLPYNNSTDSEPLSESKISNESDYYNENFVESRTQVEIYFTYNMQVIGKYYAIFL